MEAKSLTEPLFFDTDCISAFLWVKEQSILAKLYPGRIRIPRQSYDEISLPNVRHLKERIDYLINNGEAEIVDFDTDTEAYAIYRQLTEAPQNGHRSIGKGEAACLSLAKTEDGIIASNNLRDIKEYVIEFGIEHITTGDIMVDAYMSGLITEDEGDVIWAKMLQKRRKLGADSFSTYLQFTGHAD